MNIELTTNLIAKEMLLMDKIFTDDNTVKLNNNKNRLFLKDKKDRGYDFQLDIFKTEKRTLKIQLNHRNKSFFLIRLEYTDGRHTNPAKIDKKVPEQFHLFAGKTIQEPHVHYHLEGWGKKWALPLTEIDFPHKSLVHGSQYKVIIKAFCEEIKIVEPVKIETDLFTGTEGVTG